MSQVFRGGDRHAQSLYQEVEAESGAPCEPSDRENHEPGQDLRAQEVRGQERQREKEKRPPQARGQEEIDAIAQEVRRSKFVAGKQRR